MGTVSRPSDLLDHYRKCLLRLFNRNRLSSDNPDAAFFYAFAEKDLAELWEVVPVALRELGRPFVIIECTKKTSRQIYAEAARALGKDVSDKADAYTASNSLDDALLNGAASLVLYMLSASKMSGKPGFARGLIKLLDDAHIHGVRAMSDIIFIDRASFLEKAWPDIGSYLRLISPFDSWTEWMDKLDDNGRPVLRPVE